METTWQGHSIKVTGNWIARYLFLAPQYELWLDDKRLDVSGGPRMRPRLEAIIETDGVAPSEEEDMDENEAEKDDEKDDETTTRHHIEAHVLSIAGFRPLCELSIDGQLVHSERVKVQNILNPFLLLFIMIATSWMLYVGPDVLRSYLQ